MIFIHRPDHNLLHISLLLLNLFSHLLLCILTSAAVSSPTLVSHHSVILSGVLLFFTFLSNPFTFLLFPSVRKGSEKGLAQVVY